LFKVVLIKISLKTLKSAQI